MTLNRTDTPGNVKFINFTVLITIRIYNTVNDSIEITIWNISWLKVKYKTYTYGYCFTNPTFCKLISSSLIGSSLIWAGAGV
jgi:hypothetical protein